jgi:hypothetical protein
MRPIDLGISVPPEVIKARCAQLCVPNGMRDRDVPQPILDCRPHHSPHLLDSPAGFLESWRPSNEEGANCGGLTYLDFAGSRLLYRERCSTAE